MITESLSLFLADFGVNATFGTITKKVILDMPDRDILGGRVQSVDYEITYITADFPSLAYQSAITVDGIAYTVLTTSIIDDGKFSKAQLQKT